MVETLDGINYLAFQTDEITGPLVQHGDTTLRHGYSQLSFNEGALPIATTTGLPEGYYDGVETLDTRYGADRERAHYLGKLEEFIQTHPEVPAHLYDFFRTCIFEPKFLAMYFDSPDPHATDPGQTAYFFNYYDVKSYDEALVIRNRYYGTPLPVREFARTDISTIHDVMTEISEFNGIGEITDARTITKLLVDEGVAELSGEARLQALRDLRPKIEELLAEIVAKEALSTDSDISYKRLHRKKSPLDGLDAATFRACINNGVVVNPAYLFNPRYTRLQAEPAGSRGQRLGFLKHMVNGEWRFGHSHALLYRNKGDASTTHAGVAPDYGVTRPGNFLYHDLKMLEYGPEKHDFPLETLFEYILQHYLYQMDTDTLGANGQPLNTGRGASINLGNAATRDIIPLVHEPEHVIPFRALKKGFDTEEYFEYGEECYIAELVDMALQLEVTERLRGTVDYSQLVSFGLGSVGQYSQKLISALRQLGGEKGLEAASVAVEQLLFMQGESAKGGREAVKLHLKSLSEKLDFTELATDSETESLPQKRLPLTCAYEWFMRRSQLVPKPALTQLGVINRPAIFSQD